MTPLSDPDWERVNAFHDGALAPDEARDFAARLAAEPALAAALADVEGLARGLSGLRPALAEVVVPPRSGSRSGSSVLPRVVARRAGRTARRWGIGASVSASVAAGLAACLALAVFLGGVARGPERLLDIHTTYVAQQFDVTRSAALYIRAPATPEQPDLTGGNLTPVALRGFGDGTVAHYAGRNGCRLSYFRGRGTVSLPGDSLTQASVWTTRDGLQHALIATGMDAGKFDAIAAYLHQRTKQRALDHLYAALTLATDRATPCRA